MFGVIHRDVFFETIPVHHPGPGIVLILLFSGRVLGTNFSFSAAKMPKVGKRRTARSTLNVDVVVGGLKAVQAGGKARKPAGQIKPPVFRTISTRGNPLLFASLQSMGLCTTRASEVSQASGNVS